MGLTSRVAALGAEADLPQDAVQGPVSQSGSLPLRHRDVAVMSPSWPVGPEVVYHPPAPRLLHSARHLWEIAMALFTRRTAIPPPEAGVRNRIAMLLIGAGAVGIVSASVVA